MKSFRKIVLIAAAAMAAMCSLVPVAQAGALSDYLENKLVDHVFRATAYTAPTTIYVALYTSACTDAAGGTEVSGGAYARVAITNGLTTWAGTQAAASTVASTGTGGTTSNNAVATFVTPTAGWGTVTYVGLLDAVTSGNLLVCTALTTSKTINTGDAVSFPAATLSVQIDN